MPRWFKLYLTLLPIWTLYALHAVSANVGTLKKSEAKMSVRIHYFKVWPEPFEALAIGAKLHEVRKDDRERRPAVGDLVVLREWRPGPAARRGLETEIPDGEYTGRELSRRVTYVSEPSTWGLPDDLYVMSVREEGR